MTNQTKWILFLSAATILALQAWMVYAFKDSGVSPALLFSELASLLSAVTGVAFGHALALGSTPTTPETPNAPTQP